MAEGVRGTDRSQTRRLPPHPLDLWRQAAESLSEQGRLAWLLGQSLAQILQQLQQGEELWRAGQEEALRQLENLVRRAVGSAPPVHPGFSRGTPRGGAARPTVTAAPAEEESRRRAGASALRLEDSLSEHRYLVLYVGSAEVRGEWATLALGVDLSGTKHVLGLWPGATADATVSERVIQELTRRGFSAVGGLLVVSEGERAFDGAVQAAWGPAALIAHCQDHVCDVVLAHLPATSQAAARTELRQAWSLPPQEAAEALARLARQWQKPYPGAASYLLRHGDATLTVSRLHLPAVLSRRLVTLAPVRTVFQRSLQASPSQATGVEAIRPGLASWRLRRLQGYQAFPWLVRALAEHAAQGVKEPGGGLAEKSGHATALA